MPKGVYKRTEEHKRKIGLCKKGHIPWNKGLKGVQKGWNKGIKFSEESRKKMSLAKKGTKQSKEHIEKTRKRLIGNKYALNSKRTKEVRDEMSRNRKGNMNYNWRGDEVGYQGIHGWLLKNFKKDRCEFCGCNDKILDWAKKTECKYERKRENFLVLCRSCHNKYDNKAKHNKI